MIGLKVHCGVEDSGVLTSLSIQRVKFVQHMNLDFLQRLVVVQSWASQPSTMA